MDLNTLFSAERLAYNPAHIDTRTVFQRDFDRIIFSSPFRRLQNKTQVFPLPGSVFVHNRLTHSLEVASVGRSLGSEIGGKLAGRYGADLSAESVEFYKYSLSSVIASAALCHDIGNPAFGHSGEDAIASYFVAHASQLKGQFSDAEWSDFVNFEGNANAIRVLTHQQNGKTSSGFDLTMSTLSAIAKYPCESAAKAKGFIHRKKFGFFQGEAENFRQIAAKTSMIQESESPLIFKRHPFVWLVEAADDICYSIIDLEDAHRLFIVEHEQCIELLVSLIEQLGEKDIPKLRGRLSGIDNRNEQVSLLRAKAISGLIRASVEIYDRDFEQILKGEYQHPLFDTIRKDCPALTKINEISIRFIYNHKSVVEIENAGYNVMSELLSTMVPPVLASGSARTKAQDKAFKLVPEQFRYEDGTGYQQVMGVLDFVSGMTDNYATDLYRKIKGIDMGMTI